MPRRAASVTQADIARAIRALRDAGFPLVRVVMRDGSVIVEPMARRNGEGDSLGDRDGGERIVIL